MSTSSTTKRPRFKPAFTDEQVKSFEANYNETWGVGRRITMIVLSRSSTQLIDGFAPMIVDDDGDACIQLIEQITDYRDHLQASVELAEAALARLLIVGEYAAEGGAA